MLGKTLVFPNLKVGNRRGNREWEFITPDGTVIWGTAPLMPYLGSVKYLGAAHKPMGPLEIERELDEKASIGLILIKATTGTEPILGEIAMVLSPGVLKENEGAELIPPKLPAFVKRVVVSPGAYPVRRASSSGGRRR